VTGASLPTLLPHRFGGAPWTILAGRFRVISGSPKSGGGLVDHETVVDVGDELLAQIISVVRSSPLPVHRKLKSLARAGKIGEMYLGQYADECADRAFTSASAP
jgi:hypothetical protein